MMKALYAALIVFVLAGCASSLALNTGPEFNQKVLLMVDDSYRPYQATRSVYDSGDLQNFHSQHTFGYTVEEAFREIFGSVEVVKSEAGIQMGMSDVPALFEVRMVDLANDIYTESETYRAITTIAVAMKSPTGQIFWQQAFRGDGHVYVDPQFSTGLGPNDAVIAAVSDAISQMQEAIVRSPDVRNHLKYYKEIKTARESQLGENA